MKKYTVAVLGATGAVETFTPKEVCLGIVTITLLAFIAAGSAGKHTNTWVNIKTKENKISRIDICNPGLFRYELA